MKRSKRIKQAFKARKAETAIQSSKIKDYSCLFFAFLFLMIASYILTKEFSIFKLF